MNKRSSNEFQRDVEMRQRNIIYPDTLRNEAKGWRSIITSKSPLSVLQVVGLLTLCLSALGLLLITGNEIFSELREASGAGEMLQILGAYGVFLALIGALFLLFRWRVRKALGDVHKRPPFAK